MGLKILHSADWHLDSPFAGVTPEQRDFLRAQQRLIPGAITDLAKQEQCDLILLSGDVFDGPASPETVEEVRKSLASCGIRVLIAPGNHDFCAMGSVWTDYEWPDNVYVFKKGMKSLVLKDLDCRIYGAAFTSMDCPAVLEGFRAEGSERYRIALLHGDPVQKNSPYNPVTVAQVRGSGLTYLALGHVHTAGAFRAGKTYCAWPGCPMGRGWDETGEKGVCIVTLDEQVDIRPVSLNLVRFLQMAANVSQKHPVVISKFMQNTKEVEMDAVAKDGEILAYAISEHIEYAGVHSGDATIQFPAQKLYVETVRRIKKISAEIARELHISGPFNIQYLARDNEIKVIECNLRASRSFPFVSKILKINLIDLATKVMLGRPVTKPEKSFFDFDYVGIKASQFSFNRLQKADPVLGVDMASTGEVGCLGDDTNTALMKAMLAVGNRIPQKGVLLSTGQTKDKAAMLDAAKMLISKGYQLYATKGTSRFLKDNKVPNTLVYWPSEPEKTPQALDLMHSHEIDMVVNIPKNLTVRELDNGYKIRRAAIDLNIPLVTNSRLAATFINAFCNVKLEDIDIKAWGEY